MKNRIIQMSWLVGLLVVLAFSAEAQMAQKYRANIPFDFSVGNKSFAAGEYIIERTNPGVSHSALVIRDAKSGRAKIFQIIETSGNERPEVSKLVFNRYENQYFLAEMTVPTLGAKFYRTSREKELAKLRKPARETVSIK